MIGIFFSVIVNDNDKKFCIIDQS